MIDQQKNIPSLRAIATPDRATTVKARESWQMWGIISSSSRPRNGCPRSARPYRSSAARELHPTRRATSAPWRSPASYRTPGLRSSAAAERHHGSRQQGAFAGRSPSVGLNIELPHEQCEKRVPEHLVAFPTLFRA